MSRQDLAGAGNAGQVKMLTCKEASHLLSESQERPLSFWERWGLRLHLWMCESCRRFEQQLTLLRKAMRSLGQRTQAEVNGAELPPDSRERIRRALAEGRPQGRD